MNSEDIIRHIKETGQRVLPRGSRLLLYGSRARGDAHPDSDWDLLILLDKNREEPGDFLSYSYPLIELGLDMQQYFSTHIYTLSQWAKMSSLPYYHNVERDKITLI